MEDLKDFEIMLHDAEVELDRLRALYEGYFQGRERREPTIAHKRLERAIYTLRKELPRNTSLRFRSNQLFQKWSTYQMYWRRTKLQIELGRYRPHLIKARRIYEEADTSQKAEALEQEQGATPEKKKRDEKEKKGNTVWELDMSGDVDLDMQEFEYAAPKASPDIDFNKKAAPKPKTGLREMGERTTTNYVPPVPSKKPTPAKGPRPAGAPAAPPARPASKGGLAEADMRRIYNTYVKARKQNNERVDNVRYEKVAGKIAQMLPELQKKHKGKKIDFDVVVKNGKVGLKPVPKK